MFIGNMDTLGQEKETYPQAVLDALNYLRSTDFTKMEDGKYVLDGERVYATLQRYVTRMAGGCRPESHRRYVDIQYVVEGEESLGWCPLSPDLKEAVPYDEEKDIVFYEKLVPESSLVLLPGSFAVIYPEDVHCPCCSINDEPSQVTKVVVKIAVELC